MVFSVGSGFAAVEAGQARARVVQVVDPSELLAEVTVPRLSSAFGGQVLEGFELGEEFGQSSGLEGEEIVPLVLVTDREDGSIGVEGVAQEAYRQLGEVGLEGLSQSLERLQFAILFIGVGVGVLDELAAHREGQTLGGDQFGL
jgi:hypothetical protein